MDERIRGLLQQLQQGKMNRRDFVRYATLLGLSVAASEALSACAPTQTPIPTATPTHTPWPIPTVPEGYILNDLNQTPVAYGTPPQVYAPTYVPSSGPQSTATPVLWERAQWACPNCEARFDSQDALVAHLLEEHVRKVPGVRRVGQPTYTRFLTADLARFDQRNHALSRSSWDRDYQRELGSAVPRPGRESPAEMLEGYARVSGAIYVDDTAGSLNPNYGGYSGHLQDSAGLYNWDDPVSPNQYPVMDPAAVSQRIKHMARFYGADLVGICRLDPRWVYSHYFDMETAAYGKLDVPYTFAVVMGIEMQWSEINTSPRFGASAVTALAYSRMAEVSSKLAKYIRSLGHPAVPSGNDTAQSIPLAIDAGLGELGRMGLLLTAEFGARQSLCKVLSDLPLVPDQPIDFGIQRYCEICLVCAKNCPPRVIRFEDRTTQPTSVSNRPGVLRWPVNVTGCYKFWLENGMDCSNCVRACPWSAPNRNWI